MNDLPLIVRVPSDDLFITLHQRILALQPAPALALEHWAKRQDFSPAIGTAAEGLQAIRSAVELDHETNLAEASEAPYTFDYVLEWADISQPDALARGLSLLTRLTAKHDSAQGKIMYGASIFRVDDTRFNWWAQY